MLAGGAKILRLSAVTAGALICTAGALPQAPNIPPTDNAGHIRSLTGDEREKALQDHLAGLAAQVRRSPDDAEALATYGLALVRAGQHDEGLNALMRAGVKSPNEPRVLLLYSKGLIQAGHLEQAIAKALKTAQSPLATKEQMGEAYSVAGFARYRQGKAGEAENYLRKAIKATPQNSGALLNLGLVLYGTGRRATGVSLMEKAAILAPEDPKIQRIVADLYDNMGQPHKSLEAWERVSAAYPEDVEIHLKVAMGWISLGAAEKAISHLKKCVELNPGVRRAHLLLSSALLQVEEFEQARQQANIARDLGANITQLMQVIEEEEAAAQEAP